MAAGLAAEGVGPGDAVGLLGAEQPGLGGRVPRRDLARRDRDADQPGADAEEIATQLQQRGRGGGDRAEPLRAAVVETGLKRFALESLPSGGGDPGAPPVDPAGDLVALPFSSGTTGLSKGVMLTHRNLVANMEQIRAVHRVSGDDVLVGVLPFFHIYGQVVVLNLGLSQGATIVTLPRFEMGAFLDVLERHGSRARTSRRRSCSGWRRRPGSRTASSR